MAICMSGKSTIVRPEPLKTMVIGILGICSVAFKCIIVVLHNYKPGGLHDCCLWIYIELLLCDMMYLLRNFTS